MRRHALWLAELQSLAVKYSAYGVGPDLGGLTLAQCWGLYLFLRRIAEGL